ncbi:uroporphyrinogen-III C-methyltransferase [Endozoicomonas sp.]|nr:uroporphyrinogen-III C-methyltransferase [Endozoicomonas sp.]
MSNTTQKKSESTPESGTSKAKPISKTAGMQALRSVHPVAIVALVLSLTALGSIAYVGWQGLTLEQQISNTKPHLKKLDSKLFLQSNQLASTKAHLEPLQEKANNLDQRSERLLVDVSALSAKVKALEGSSRADSHLAEVEYLLRLASQRLLMSSDIEGADKLLHSANDILLALDDYSLFSVREALASDIAALNAVPSFDLEGAYFRLQAVSGYVKSLPLLKADQFSTSISDSEKETQNAEENNWQLKATAVLDQLWQDFASLFRFTSKREKALNELLTPEQGALVRQNLQLLIEQAKLALLVHQPTIYRNSLLEADMWLDQYFLHNADAVDAIRQELARLASLDISPKLPTINTALEALKQYHSNPPVPPQLKPVVSEGLDNLPLRRESHSKFSPPVDVSSQSGAVQL